jgi:hypothetical protein
MSLRYAPSIPPLDSFSSCSDDFPPDPAANGKTPIVAHSQLAGAILLFRFDSPERELVFGQLLSLLIE